MVYTPCQKGFVYETPRSIDLGRLVVECGLYPMWEWNPETRAFNYSFRPASMRPVSNISNYRGASATFTPSTSPICRSLPINNGG